MPPLYELNASRSLSQFEKFGQSVSAFADLVVVGAPGNGHFKTGAIFVFERSGGNWHCVSELRAPSGYRDIIFGSGVACTDDLIMASSIDVNFRIGYVWLFKKKRGQWVRETSPLHPSKSTTFSDTNFGSAIDIRKQTALISGFGNDSAYVFELGRGGWQQRARLISKSIGRSDGFGKSVALSNNAAYIGAPRAYNNAGTISVFHGSGAGWQEAQPLRMPSFQPQDRFGWSVATNLSAVVGGSPSRSPSQQNLYGSQGAILLKASLNGPTVLLDRRGIPSPAALGTSVDISNDLIVAGAPRAGLVTVYNRQGGTTPKLQTTVTSNKYRFGFGHKVQILQDRYIIIATAPSVAWGKVHIYELL